MQRKTQQELFRI